MEVGNRRLESGVWISWGGKMEEEIRSRIGKVARVIGVLNEPIWKREELSRRTKLGVNNAIMHSAHIGVWK